MSEESQSKASRDLALKSVVPLADAWDLWLRTTPNASCMSPTEAEYAEQAFCSAWFYGIEWYMRRGAFYEGIKTDGKA